jgi:hypothetical protein
MSCTGVLEGRTIAGVIPPGARLKLTVLRLGTMTALGPTAPDSRSSAVTAGTKVKRVTTATIAARDKLWKTVMTRPLSVVGLLNILHFHSADTRPPRSTVILPPWKQKMITYVSVACNE